MLLIIFFTSSTGHSQTQVKKKAAPAQLEIDRLYANYKDQESTSIYFPGGSLYGEVSIDLNDNGKPREISITGKEDDVKTISKFLSYYIKQKVSKGFKEDGEISMNTGWDASSIEFSLDHFDNEIRINLIKGKEYTTIYCYKDKVKHQFAEFGSKEYFENKFQIIYYNFVVTTGDMRRIAGSNSKPFDF